MAVNRSSSLGQESGEQRLNEYTYEENEIGVSFLKIRKLVKRVDGLGRKVDTNLQFCYKGYIPNFVRLSCYVLELKCSHTPSDRLRWRIRSKI